MLTDTDERVRASINLHAVLGALPRLIELVPAAGTLLAGLDRPVVRVLRTTGGVHSRPAFSSGGVVVGGRAGGRSVASRTRAATG